MTGPAFAGLDWGTTHLRAWLMTASGEVVAGRRSDQGLLAVPEGRFADVMEEMLGALGADASLPVIMCGMVGSRQGWVEAPYVPAPALIGDLCDGAIEVRGLPRRVLILPGVARTGREAPDVMRGEETQLAGLPGPCSGTVCLPGTHSKWVEIRAGRIERFTTFMTGELFSLLSGTSILRHAVQGAERQPDPETFLEWSRESLARPSEAIQRLFRIRASALLYGMKPEAAAAALSGLLIGSEIASALEAYPAARQSVMLVGSGPLADAYAKALDLAGSAVTAVDAETAVRRGLAEAARRLLGRDA